MCRQAAAIACAAFLTAVTCAFGSTRVDLSGYSLADGTAVEESFTP